MTLMPGPATTAPARRGCGGRGGCGGGCTGCGDGTTVTGPASGTAFVRPRFFGGMLLTEDDLQAVTDYVVGKRRLMNRQVLGAGVVCGLDVSCDPCERGSVVVDPGSAIDCCGNDIVVDCPTQVDVVALVRELRQRSGVDCGEPCGDRPCQDYVLNVVYTETPSDPVAPYADDTCAVGDCEFSRVREGYRFELSCDPPEPEPSIVDVLRACADVDDDRVKEDAAVMARVVRLGMSQERVEGSEPVPAAADVSDIPVRSELDEVDHPDAEFAPTLAVVRRATVALVLDAASQAGLEPSMGLNAARRKLLSTRTRDLARRLLASDELTALPASERVWAERLLKVAEAQENLAEQSVAALRQPGASAVAEGIEDGTPEEVYVRDAARMKSRVLRGLADAGRAGCREYREVSALRLSTLDETAPREVQVLGRTFVSVLVRCVCAAANPRCPTCTDARVPLARLRVEGCEVVSVCDLERRWVHSPRALAYSFPVVDALRRLLQRRCCPDDCEGRYVDRLAERAQAQVREREVDILREQAVGALRMVRPPEDVPALREVLEALGDEFLDGRDLSAGASTSPFADPRVATLEEQVRELTRKLEDLAGRQP